MSGPRVILSAAFAVLTLASAVALSFRRADSDAEAWVSILVPVLVGAGVILLLNLVAGAWATRAGKRASRLATQQPDAVVIESGRLGGLQKFLTVDGAIELVAYVTVSFDSDGVRFWKGYSPPIAWREIPAEQLLGVSVEDFAQDGRVRARLRLSTRDGDVTVPVLGRGLVRMMSPDMADVQSIATRVAAIFRWERNGDDTWA